MTSAAAATRTDQSTDSHRLLAIYLRDHHAGSCAGLALARRGGRSNAGTPYEELFAYIEREITDERQQLATIMERLDVEPSVTKQALGRIAEVAARVKSNGRLFRYSPSSRVVELEALAAALVTKRNLWRALRNVDGDVVGALELDRLTERANAQIDRVLDAHDRATAEAFGPARSGR